MSKKITNSEIESLFREKLREHFPSLYMTISLSKLEEVVQDIGYTISMFRGFRLQAIKRFKKKPSEYLEYEADCLFFSHCILSCLYSMANVLIYIKQSKNADAWDSLIDANEYLGVANVFIKKYPHNESLSSNGIQSIKQRCDSWEKAFFPTLQYTSAGFTETIGRCSVCLSDFLSCEHIEGFIYHGIFCKRIDRKIIEGNHVALVKNPKDRRCFFETSHDDEGYQIDVFSRERLNGQTEPKPQEFLARILSSRSLDL
ncbi:hypothetical protein [Cronobacter sakazakii]|uniref:hypothetical protein n=1 Tax=Cronobacter sakazakii TaxID=28141 RepID=UPI0011B03F5B|nr:hypothetical protein [Cronobacter sakazakii]